MRTLIWSKSFVRASRKFIKKNPKLIPNIENTLKYLVDDPFISHLETHKLKGNLSGTWACSLGYSLRIVFEFVANENRKDDDIYLIDIGTHDEVY